MSPLKARTLGTAQNKALEVSRSLGSAQKATVQSAFDLFCRRGSHFRQFDHIPDGVRFDTPEEDAAVAKTAAEDALIEKAVAKAEAKIEEKYKARFNGMNQVITDLKKAQKTATVKDDTADDQDNDGVDDKKKADQNAQQKPVRATEKEKEQAAQIKLLMDDREAVNAEKRRVAIQNQIPKLNIDPEWQDDFEGFLERTAGKKIVVDKATKAVLYRESEDDEGVPIADWLKDQADAGKFKKYVKGKETVRKGPNNGNAGGGNGGMKSMTHAEYCAAARRGDQGLDKVQILEG